MTRRNTASARAHGAAPLSLVTPAPVVARKRARRAKDAPAAAPAYVKPAIDLTRADARKALAVAFPVASPGKIVAAGAAEEAAALAYFEARDAESRAQGAKEASGNALRYAIGDAEAIHGDGWIATWKSQRGTIDRGALITALGIEAHVGERFRTAPARVLNVRETAE
jgi:hypothetical protein